MAVAVQSTLMDVSTSKPGAVHSQAKQNVFFKFLDGRTLCLFVNPRMEDIASLKNRLLSSGAAGSSFVFASQDVFLVWNGKPLDDDCVLADYNMYNNATVHCYYRNKGGCFALSATVVMVIIASVIGSTCTCGLSLCLVPLLLPLLFVLPLFCL